MKSSGLLLTAYSRHPRIFFSTRLFCRSFSAAEPGIDEAESVSNGYMMLSGKGQSIVTYFSSNVEAINILGVVPRISVRDSGTDQLVVVGFAFDKFNLFLTEGALSTS